MSAASCCQLLLLTSEAVLSFFVHSSSTTCSLTNGFVGQAAAIALGRRSFRQVSSALVTHRLRMCYVCVLEPMLRDVQTHLRFTRTLFSIHLEPFA